MRGNLSHARNGRGIKFSLPILSPSRKKQSYILRGRTPPIHGGGFCKNSIFLSHLPSPFLVKVERSVGLALPVTGRRERTIFVSFKRDKNIVTRSQSVFLSTDCYRLFFFFFLNRPDSSPPQRNNILCRKLLSKIRFLWISLIERSYKRIRKILGLNLNFIQLM